jgi:TonB-dependent SusC/RagA subfamily outer membrane receptor
VKSTKQIVETDSLGRFSVGVNNTDKLKATAHGFNNQSIKLKENTKVVGINMNLISGEKGRAYAIGYGHVLDEDKLNAVSQMTQDDVDFSKYSTMYDLIRGKFAGVQVIGNQVIIRGIKGNSNSAALIVVDGVSRNRSVLSAITPSQVKSINIIKDGSSAVYGIKGANGVVVIETKAAGKGY